MKDNHSNVSGKNNPMYGKHHSEESIKKMSESRKKGIREGRIIPNSSMYGKKHSKETRKKMSISAKKSIYKGRFKGKNNSMYGKQHSEETRKKMKERRAKRIFPVKDTKIEVKIQNFLSLLHLEFFTHKYISEITHSYQCDILIPKQETEGVIIPQKTIIEADGCYWHGCPICKLNSYKKLGERKQLDNNRTKELQEKGFRVIRLWEHEIKQMEVDDLRNKII